MKRFIPVLLLIGLAGCNDNRGPLVPDFGNAISHNIAVQAIRPDPLVGAPDANTSGQRMSDAIDRYRKDKVTPPISPIQSPVPMGSPVQTGPATP